MIKKVIKFSVKSALHPAHASRRIRFELRRRELSKRREADYVRWFDSTRLSESELNNQKESVRKDKKRPKISILLPTYNTKPIYLRECIESVISQTYDNWELCISDDASPNEETKLVIREYVERYDNIHATFNSTNKHIAESSNVALDMASGDYISLLDHDDLLPPNALYEVYNVIKAHPDIDLIYTDEDKVDETGKHIEPFFKPDWSPDFLNSCNVITHFATMRSDVIKGVGGFTAGTHGAQDWDLFLKITQKTDKVFHIPKILYHWRKSETSTAKDSKSKPYAYINQGKVLRKSIVERDESAYVIPHAALGFWRKSYAIQGHPLVSIVIPTKDQYERITACVDSILEKTTYPFFEIVIVDTGSTDANVLSYYNKLANGIDSIRIVQYGKQKFNFSKACNIGAEEAEGEYLLFLNNDTEIITHSWIQAMLEHAQRDSIGMVGAKLLFPDQTIQHAGIVLSERDIAFHPFYAQHQLYDIFTYIYLSNIRNVSAVTAACSMVSKRIFEEAGGFDERLRVTYNDVDLNLRIGALGYKNLYTPYAELFHYESISVGRINTDDRNREEYNEAYRLMKERWGDLLRRDPYYNDNFEQHGPGYRL